MQPRRPPVADVRLLKDFKPEAVNQLPFPGLKLKRIKAGFDPAFLFCL